MNAPTQLTIMHVLFSRGFAGSERSTLESCNQQCKHHQVILVVRKGHRKNAASIVDSLDKRVKLIEVSHIWFTRWQVKKLIQHYQPNVVHCHLRKATRVVGKIRPNAATVSTLHISANGKCFNKMDGLICNARWQVEALTGHYAGLIHKAHNSLTPHRKLTKAQIRSLRHELNLDDNTYLIGAVGRFHPSKAWDTLIQAFMQLPQSYKQQCRLVFFGNGKLEQELKNLAKGEAHIQFAGFKNNIKDYYQCFDLLVCPSRFEPLPRVMLEAMDAGTPVIASDEGGCKELIEEYGGFMFPVDNIEALASQLQYCIDTKPAKNNLDLSAHYIENANQAIINFYQLAIQHNTKQSD
ncbi:glycosyltransferase family 4 domain-containing protein [Catenovulum agarivorans DS-2]|uniref:Glycosyltransferase family 4 domain-containing protein n=1 Tax=Catenovulum agarivorans DS-2 TaxID=1328313 RepID=W7QH41_9ALTE|nr:glycosyltransferase [Catenovulum agarivorans]EWH11186.1 glycosyltransferase family 4 domain-containing protein [Catenovulum agarivorans DS-2]